MKFLKKHIIVLLITLLTQQSFGQALIDSLAGGGFESGPTFFDNGWTVQNETFEENNLWVVGSTADGVFAGSRGAYISTDNGATVSYTNNTVFQYVYQDVTFPAGQPNIRLSFNWKCQGQAGKDYLKVYMVPSTYTLNHLDYTPLNTGGYSIGAIGGYLESVPGNWVYEEIDINSAFAGTTQKLVFMWINDAGSVANQQPIAIDNVSLISFPLPGNDNCTGAYNLPTGAICTYTAGDTFLSTGSPDPSCAPSDANDDIWYSFVADDPRMKISVLGATGFNAGFSVYSGACGALAQLSCINNSGSGGLETTVLGGLTVMQTYYIRVYSIGTPTNTNFQICLNYPPPPTTNDECGTAITITSGVTCNNTPGSTTDASTSAIAAPSCAAVGVDDDVWYKFVATQPVLVTSVKGSPGFDPVVAVYSDCAAANFMKCANNNGVAGTESVTVSSFTVGQTYYARVYSAGGGAPIDRDFNICVFEGPQNDECIGAIDLTIGATCTYTSGSTLNSSSSPVTAPSCNAGADDDVWFKFVAGSAGVFVDLKAANALFDPAYAIYSGANCNSLTEITCSNETGVNDAENRILGPLTLVNGNTYYIRVFGAGTTLVTTPSFQICLTTPPPPPANDECISAIAINTNETCTYTAGTTRFSSASPQTVPSCATTEQVNDDVWYSFVADKSVLVVKLQGLNNFNPAYAVYSGNCGSLTEVSCVNANATLGGLENKTITSYTIGQTYYVRVYSAQTTFPTTSTSNFQLCVNWGPQNDECAGAFSVPVGAVCTTTFGTTFESTQSTQVAPSCAATGINDDVWYKFVPDSSRTQINITGAAGFDAAYVLYEGGCNALTEKACINDANSGLESKIFGSLISSLTYYVRVFSTPSVPIAASTFDVCIQFPPPPPTNDECVNAITLPTGINCSYTAGTTLNSSQSPQPQPNCGNASYDDDVWFKFVADSSRIKLDIDGNGTFNPVFTVYSGDCSSFTTLMCNDATLNGGLETTILSNLVRNQTYYVRVFGLGTAFNANPTFDICATYAPPAPPNDDCFNAIQLGTAKDCELTFGNTYGASSNFDYPDPGCGNNGADDDVWYKFFAGRDKFELTLNSGNGFDGVIAFYEGNFCSNLNLVTCVNASTSGQTETTILSSLSLGHTYYIRIFGSGNSSAATSDISSFSLCLTDVPSIFCGDASQFCTQDEPYVFNPGAGSTLNAPEQNALGQDNFYGCMQTQPNPNWYYLKMLTSGPVILNMNSTPTLDIDFVIWGPFADGEDYCNLLNQAHYIACGYTTTHSETGVIQNAIAGQNYLVLITNFSRQAILVEFDQTGGTGETDCSFECPKPVGLTPVNYCKNSPATELTAGGVNLKWYTQAIGGVGSTVAPIPITTAVGTTKYWVSQSPPSCDGDESERFEITVNVTDKPSAANIIVTDGDCLGTNAARIRVASVTDGAAPFTYSFNGAPFVNNNTITGLATNDNYSVEVKDAAGCTYLTTVSVSSYPGVSTFTLSKTEAACGQTDASITVSNVMDGTLPYLYSFNNSSFTTNNVLTGISAGNYQVVVKDQLFCTYSQNIAVSNSGGPTDVTITVTDATCGASNGAFTLSNVIAGTAPFSYTFNGSPYTTNTSYINISPNLPSYSVSVKDATGCIYVENFDVNNIEGPTLVSYTPTPSLCGVNNAAIEIVSVTGGVATYSYRFNSSLFSTNVSYTGLTANTSYTLTIKDSEGCELDTVFTLPNIAGPTTYNVSAYGTSCGDSNGRLFINSVSGGTAPYRYSFNNAAYNTNTIITGISVGTYSFSVKDANECTIQDQLIFNNIDGPKATTLTIGSTYCNQINGRVIVKNVMGGAPPYRYSFNGSPFRTNTTITGLAVGSYTLQIKDDNGCIFDTTYRIGSVLFPSATISGSGTICGNSLDPVKLNVNLVGTSPWTFVYTDGTNITTVTNVTSSPYELSTSVQGDYTLINVTTQVDGCVSNIVSGVSEVLVKPVPDAPLVSNVRYCFDTDTLKLMSLGNVGDIYKWYNDEAKQEQIGSTTSQLFYPPTESNVGENDYYVTRTADGCTSSAAKVIVSAEQVVADFVATPNYGEKPLTVFATNLTTGTNTYVWDFGNSQTSTDVDASTIYDVDGTYIITLTATSDIKCIDTATTTIIVEPNYSVVIPNVFSPNGDGPNDIFTITYIGVKSVSGYIYNRWGKKVFDINSITDQWNGKIKGDGSDAPDGVYFLVLNVTPLFGEVKEYKNTITLVR
ncbi:MAG: gliding motility-associated C-terminal domain-containing protein [Bacteroidota bacterium]